MTIDQFNFAGKKAFVRVDFNVPLDENFNITVDTQNNFFLYRLYHTITSINVGKPITLSLNIFSNSSFSFTPCS